MDCVLTSRIGRLIWNSGLTSGTAMQGGTENHGIRAYGCAQSETSMQKTI